MTVATPDYASIYSGPRGAAVKILNRVERTDAYLDKLLDAELKSGDIADIDKGLLSEIVHGVLRWQGRLDWILNGFTHGNFTKSEINVKNALRVGLYQVLFLTQVPQYAAVNEAVGFIKRLRGDKSGNLVNAVLRNIIRSQHDIHYPKREDDSLQYLAVYYAHPQWLVKRWLERFGQEETERILVANNEIPAITLRINRLKTTSAEFLALLDKSAIAYQGSAFLDHFLRVRGLAGIAQMNIFQNGLFTIQDESAALPVILLAPKEGERVIDMCAAPGGKTTFIAEVLANTGHVVAVDKYESKLAMIETACRRLGITNVERIVADSQTLETAPADKILVDAPCSGLGVLRKKPDIKWKREPDDVTRLNRTQRALLENAARLLKPGGAIVYSTCTTEPEENIGVVRAFLAAHPEFTIDDAAAYVNRTVVTPEGWIETFPHLHHIDGSFAIRLRKAP